MVDLVFCLIVGSVALIAFVILSFISRVVASSESARPAPSQPTSTVYDEEDTDPGVFGTLTPALAGVIPESARESSDFAQLMRRAGLYSPSDRGSVYALRFVMLVVPLILTLIVATWLVPPNWMFPALIAGGILSIGLSIIPRFYVYLRQRTRVRDIRHGLADMMDMLSMCLSGGLPISASLDHVARNMSNYPALSQELHIMRRQADVGSLQHALNDFARRVDIPEVRQLASLLSRGDQLGTQLSHSLHEQADHFRETRKQIATLQANRAPVKLTFPLVFCFAPAALIFLMSPALLQISDFAQNSEDFLGQSQLVRQVEELEQGTALQVGATDSTEPTSATVE